MLSINRYSIFTLFIIALGGWLLYNRNHSQSYGTLILISGGSSCGKTSVSKALQDHFAKKDIPFLRIGLDDFFHAIGNQWFASALDATKESTKRAKGLLIKKTEENIIIETGPFYPKLIQAVTLGLKGFLDGKLNVIFEGASDFSGIKIALQKYNPFLFSIACPLNIVEERESKRKDNPIIGLARAVNTQNNFTKKTERIFDSSKQSSKDIAQEIAHFVEEHTILIPE